MPHERIEAGYFSPGVIEFIGLLHRHQVRYVVIGGEAVIHHSHARLTGGIDFFYDPAADNVVALHRALLEFWAGSIPGTERPEELQEAGIIIQFGRPPNRIDVLNQIDGVTVMEAWQTRVAIAVEGSQGDIPVQYLGLAELIRNKEASGRPAHPRYRSSNAVTVTGVRSRRQPWQGGFQSPNRSGRRTTSDWQTARCLHRRESRRPCPRRTEMVAIPAEHHAPAGSHLRRASVRQTRERRPGDVAAGARAKGREHPGA